MFVYTVTFMKRLCITAIVLLFFPLFNEAQKGLDSDQRDWLDQVAPIITEVERDVFKKLEAIHKAKNEVVINWYYEEDDEDMLEAGEDYESIIRVPFKMIEIVE